MHEFIKSIASSLSAPGISPRAITLFSQARLVGPSRWGRKAKLTAAASIAIARRESHKPDSLRDIAFLIDEPLSSLSRTFSSVITMLKLALVPADPALHLPTLLSHLSASFQPPPQLPTPLLKLLTPLPLNNVIATANSLSDLLARIGEGTSLAGLPTPPTACALLVLALEAEARISLPHLSDLAHYLATRFGISKGIVMARYKIVYDAVEEWIREVPWLDKFETKKGRSKVSKRVVVARGLKDVIRFQEEIWRKKLDALEKPKVDLDLDDEQDADMSDNGAFKDPDPLPPRKKKKTRHVLDTTSHFLLDPLSAPLPPSASRTAFPSPQIGPQPCFPYASYLLTASSLSLTLHAPPTRLQLLAVARGGSGEIDDEELFEEGEWESMIRNEEEKECLSRVWECGDEGESQKPTKKIASMKSANGRTGRVNMEALHRLLHKTGDTLDDGEDLQGFEDELVFTEDNQDFDALYLDGNKGDEEYGPPKTKFPGPNHRRSQATRDTEELGEWRPPSPGGEGRSDARYDEEW
jgi:transcription factor IIIB subunit 2